MVTVRDAASIATRVQDAVRTVFHGRSGPIRVLVTGLFAGLHVLIEDIPGTGKTTLARALSQACGADFGRIQCSPDLLPADITGMMIWDPHNRSFSYKAGPVMHQCVLVDELNRAATRTQAALLETMQEGSVTVDGERHLLPQPFFLIATQNPSAFTGTFPLPEAQLDRFGLSVQIGYPAYEHEIRILEYGGKPAPTVEPVIEPDTLVAVRTRVQSIHVSESVGRYVIALARETRSTALLRLGLSPRASAHLLAASRAGAAIEGRDYVVPEDVRGLFLAVAVHRVVLSAQASVEGKRSPTILEEILSRTPMPSGV
ncbi:MAG: AAA family ATPase [Spirochaetaceae bacterium]